MLSLLLRASKNTVTAIPAELLSKPILSGRKFWKWYSVSGPDEVHHVLVANGRNYPRSRVVRSLMGPALRHSLFLAGPGGHAWQRRAVLELYSARRCRELVPLFRNLASRETRSLPEEKTFRFDAAAYVERITLAASLRSACATYSAPDLDELRKAMDTYSDATLRVSVFDILKLPLKLATLLKTPTGGALNNLQEALRAEIRARQAGSAAGTDLLQCLLEARNPDTGAAMTESEVLGNLMMMVVAAHEPTASAISWAIFLLATHPDAQERAREEAIRAKVSKDSRIATPFLTAVIEETMRLYPIVTILLRDTKAPDTVGQSRVTAGSFMFVPIYALHRSPEYWSDPDMFRPERFLYGDDNRRKFLPFSVGEYSCIGKTFAMAEIHTVLTELLSDFRFSAVPGKEPTPESVMSLRPKGGVWLDSERLQDQKLRNSGNKKAAQGPL